METKRKVIIVTFSAARNYGAVLQSYALGRIVTRLGYEVEFLDFRSSKFSVGFRWNHPFSWLYYRIFSPFVGRYFRLTQRYSDLEQLKKYPPDADLYLAGSDQIWNSRMTGELQAVFFLEFVPDAIPKVSYAASFGCDTFDDMKYLQRQLTRFSMVSVREDTGVELCRQAGCPDAEHVLDPTLLFHDYASLMHGNCIVGSLTCFFLESVPDGFYRVAKILAHDLGLPAVLLNKNRPVSGFRNIAYPSVGRVLRQFSKSAFILTNSFHGVAFAIQFRKNFIFISTYPDTNSRVESLLKIVGLTARMFRTPEEALQSRIWETPIDYTSAECALKKAEDASLDYLQKALQAVE